MERTELREDERSSRPQVSRPEPEVNSSQATMLQLQQQAGNAAVAQQVAQGGAFVGPSGKLTVNAPEEKATKEFGYGQLQLVAGGSADFEIIAPGAGDSAVKGAGGVVTDLKGASYQGEVSTELHKFTSGLLEDSAWKGKFGGEASADTDRDWARTQ